MLVTRTWCPRPPPPHHLYNNTNCPPNHGTGFTWIFVVPFPQGKQYLSLFPEVEIMKSTTASAVTNRLDRIFAVHGIPSEIYSDNGPLFASDAMKQFMRDHGINHHLVTPHWPQANREVESFMKPLGKAVKAAKMEGKDWEAELQYFLFAYRTTPHCTTGVAPSQLLFNREVCTNISTIAKFVRTFQLL